MVKNISIMLIFRLLYTIVLTNDKISIRYRLYLKEAYYGICDILPPLKPYTFEVGASYSMAPMSQVSIGYPRVPRGSFFARIRAYFILAQLCAYDSLSLFSYVDCCVDISIHSVSTFTYVDTFG